MKLIIHAGMHRSGTSSTQSVLKQLRKRLRLYDIYYPLLTDNGNCYPLARTVFAKNFQVLDEIVVSARQSISENGSIIVSAEDFENFLIDHQTTASFLNYAEKIYKLEVSWVFTIRKQFDYFESLYNRLSDQTFKAPLNYSIMAQNIIERGIFDSCPADLRYFYVFDYKRYFENFKNKLNQKICVLSMDEALDPYPGVGLLKLSGLNMKQVYKLSKYIDVDAIRTNTKIAAERVEIRYTATFMNLILNQNLYDSNAALFEKIKNTRLKLIRDDRDMLKKGFENKFGANSVSIAKAMSNWN